MGKCYSDHAADKLTAARFNEWLGYHNLSAREFARRAGINLSTIYTITRGKGGTSVAILRKVCRVGGIDANWLLGLR